MVFSLMDSLYQLIAFVFFVVPIPLLIVAAIFIYRTVKRSERRAEERLKFEKERDAFQRRQAELLHEMNERLIRIENMLREVE